ncbi:MAG TPA: purine-nucleoside phosphorylase [Leucothrix sp.]|nr:purine-nucleoside phosphorylase [Leucothrix sp.]
MPTPHISASDGDYARTVLMPGDPLRAKFVAENYLDNIREVSNVRSMLGYTGTYKGQLVSVQGSGMGIPSIQIYATELYNHYGVENIIRIGSCGAVQDDINLGDVVIAIGAGTDSMVNRNRFNGYDLSATSDYGLLRAMVESAEKLGKAPHVGTIFSTDFFYSVDTEQLALLEKYGFAAIEMEAAGLYGLAAELGKKAIAVCTVSDHLKRNEQMSAEDRTSSFGEMFTIVLDAAITL